MRYTLPPELERRRTPRSQSLRQRVSSERLLTAALGACVALIAWSALAALTGVGKAPNLALPLAVAAAILGALLAVTPLARLVWIGAALAIAAFLLIAATPFVSSVLRPQTLVRSDPVAGKHLDAVIVLSGGITVDSLLTPDPLDRLLTGLALMRDGVADTLVVTEPRRTDNGATTAPDQARVRALVSRAFPMLRVDSVHTTRDEATQSWRLLGVRGATHVAVVTTPLHTSRACATFEAVGFVVTCVPAVWRAYDVTAPDGWRDRLALFRDWLYERAAAVEYRQRGWMRAHASR
jgi:uncharacterized SAM-binding protein YcdF (DUF218 family)